MRQLSAVVYGQVLGICLASTACGSSSGQPTSPGPAASFSVSGLVREVISGTHVPAPGFPVFVRVLATDCTAPVCEAAVAISTGPDGRYSLAGLPAGRVVVTASTATHTQVCGATSILATTTQLDVEITSRANRQPSLALPPLRVSGLLFRTTPAGRVGINLGEIGLDLSRSASSQTSSAFFLEVDADANGNYLACGLPANWPILFISGFEDYHAWHQFNSDTVLDIERRQP